jgi:PAS domain-containing protein
LRLLYLNPLARQYLGLPVGESLLALALSALAPALLEHYQTVRASAQATSATFLLANAAEQRLHLRLTPLFDTDGELVAIAGQLDDITEWVIQKVL